MLRFAMHSEKQTLHPSSRQVRRIGSILMIGLMTCMAGCEQTAPIITYRVPTKLPDELLPGKDRMLAAMVPKDQNIWFFKVTGPEGAVGAIEVPFRDFVEDIEFANGVPVLADLPKGWRRGGEKPFRYATLDVETEEKQLGVSVSKLPRREDSTWDQQVEDNVNRWRGQLGLGKSDQKWAEAEPLEVKAADFEPDAIWVDLVGTHNGSPMAAPFANRVPPPPPTPPNSDASGSQPALSDDRMLAAMVPKVDDVWFFKVRGSQESVASVATLLKDFVESLEFDKGVPVLTALPTGWTRGEEKPFRYATLDVETPTGKLDVSVSKLGRQEERPWEEQVEMNVNRWRGQMGLPPSDQQWAGGQPLEVKAADSGSVWVDLTVKPEANQPNVSVSAGTDQPKELLTFERPEGWRAGRLSSMRLAAFNVGPEDAPAEITVIPAGGQLRGNVARWLGQIRDGAVPDEVIDQALKDGQELTVAGIVGKRFLLTGEDPDKGRAIDATILPLGPDGKMNLFIKMTGPAETVVKESDAIASFLNSLKLNL